MTRLFGQISEPSTANLGVESWIASLADIRAKISRLPASEQALQELVDQFGKTLIESLVKSGQRLHFLRTSQGTFGWGSGPSDEISKSEATAFRRAYSRRLKLVRRINVRDSSSSPWMTARTSRGGYTRDNGDVNQERLTLEGQSQATNWPTPDSALMNNRESPETFEARRAALQAKHRNGNGAGTPLGMAVLQWPTPCTGESLTGHGRRGGKSRNGRQSGQVSAATLAKNSRPLTEIACQYGHQPEATPTAGEQSSPSIPNSLPLSKCPTRKLNPAFVGWLMNFPRGWTGPQAGTTNFERWETRSSQVVRQWLSSVCSQHTTRNS